VGGRLAELIECEGGAARLRRSRLANAEIGYQLALGMATIKTIPRIRRRGKALRPGGGT
jgi:hypothetical protein